MVVVVYGLIGCIGVKVCMYVCMYLVGAGVGLGVSGESETRLG